MEVLFYKDPQKRILKPDLFSKTAEELARKFSNPKNNRRSQVRKFYDEILRLNSLAKEKEKGSAEEWERVHPYVNMLIAKAAYAEGRDLISPDFATFIREGVNQIHEPDDLEVFANLFEAFMGFFRKHQKAS